MYKNDSLRVAGIVGKLPKINYPTKENGKLKFDGYFFNILKSIVNTIDDGKMAQLLREDTFTQEHIIISILL
jgi:hypothetical protein